MVDALNKRHKLYLKKKTQAILEKMTQAILEKMTQAKLARLTSKKEKKLFACGTREHRTPWGGLGKGKHAESRREWVLQRDFGRMER